MPRILIIEDDAEIVNSIALAFQYYWTDAEIISTHLGKQGVKIAKSGNLDAIILDLGLPDITGFEVLKKVRHFSTVPIVILTVRTNEEDVLRAIEAKANGFVAKPFRQLELMKRIQAVVDNG